ncbi:hypothetical protein EDD17DRAFT_1666847 [Pisolithus thermaeus]|nr:hypothetical protein EDD17DRAFT_1666847 [Pisolithus thermaeus]
MIKLCCSPVMTILWPGFLFPTALFPTSDTVLADAITSSMEQDKCVHSMCAARSPTMWAICSGPIIANHRAPTWCKRKP